jgi:hypothetical protein
MPTRTPAETLAVLEAQSDDDEMDSVLAMTPEERGRELEAAGFDRADGDAKADVLRAVARAPSSSVTAIRPRPLPRVLTLAAAGLALAAAVFAAVVLLDRGPKIAPITPDNEQYPHEPRPPPETPAMLAMRRAADLRKRAAASCEAQDITECSEYIVQARRLDPAGDTSPEARAVYQQIEAIRRAQKPQQDKPWPPPAPTK